MIGIFILNRRYILLFYLSFLSFSLYSGTITGTVTDEDGEPVDYIAVYIEGRSLGTTTNEDGNFKIEDIPTGEHVLSINSMGFQPYKKDVSLKKGEILQLSITLKEDNLALDEIVLTGVARETRIRENPISVSNLHAQQLETLPETNIIDALIQKTPGMDAVKTGPNISKPYIRGLGFNRVLTLFDGIRQEGQQWGEEHGMELDDYDLDRVEIIKGPASLMYGSDAIAGVIGFFPYVPKIKDGKLHGKFTTEVQTNNGLVGNAMSVGMNDGKYLFNLSGSYKMASNYHNPVDGRVYQSNFREKNVSGLLGVQSDEGYTHARFTLYDNTQAIPEGDRDVDGNTRRFTRPYFGTDLSMHGTDIPVSHSELVSYSMPDIHQRIQHYRAYVHSKYDWGKGGFDVLLSGSQNIRTEYDHPQAPGLAAMRVRLNTLTYSFRYNLPEFSDISTSVGINGFYQNNKSIDASDFPIPDYDLDEGGAFLYAKWQKERWVLSGGMRFDLGHYKWEDFWIDPHPYILDETGEAGIDQHVSGSRSEDSELLYERTRKNFNGLTASIGATYEIDEHWNLKTNFGRAYRAPNITELAANDLDPGAGIIYRGNSEFDPEFSYQIDFGFQVNYPDFTVDVSAFHNNITDFIYLTRTVDDNEEPILIDGNKEYRYEQASAKLYGGELSFSIHPTGLLGFNWDNGMAYTRGLNRDTKLKDEKRNGGYLPDIPPFKWRASLSQDIKLNPKPFKSIKPEFGWLLSAAQNEYFGRNHTETKTPGYILFNLGVETKIKYAKKVRPLTFLVLANNMFDKAYQDHLNRLKYFDTYLDEGITSPNGRYGIYDMGRSITFKAIVPF